MRDMDLQCPAQIWRKACAITIGLKPPSFILIREFRLQIWKKSKQRSTQKNLVKCHKLLRNRCSALVFVVFCTWQSSFLPLWPPPLPPRLASNSNNPSGRPEKTTGPHLGHLHRNLTPGGIGYGLIAEFACQSKWQQMARLRLRRRKNVN